MDYISIVSQLGHCLRVSYYILSIVVNIDQISHTDKFDYEESSGAKIFASTRLVQKLPRGVLNHSATSSNRPEQ